MENAIVILAIAIFGGALMAAMRLKGQAVPPLALAILHGAVVAAGLAAMGIAIKSAGVPTVTVAALGGMVLAAVAGTALFLLFHLKKKALPLPLMFVHASAAVISFILLVASVIGR